MKSQTKSGTQLWVRRSSGTQLWVRRSSGTQLWVRRSSYGVRRDQDLNFFQLFSTCFSCYQMLSNVHSLLQVFSPGFSGDQLFSTVVKWFHPASTVFSCSRLISNVPNWFHLLSTVFKFCHLFPNVFDPLHLSSSALASSGLFWFWMAWFQLCPLDLNCYHCGELRCTQDGASDPEKLLQTNLTSRCQKSSKMRREKQIISSILAPSLLGHCWLLTVLLVVHLWSGIFTRKYRPLDFWSLILVPQYVHHI